MVGSGLAAVGMGTAVFGCTWCWSCNLPVAGIGLVALRLGCTRLGDI